MCPGQLEGLLDASALSGDRAGTADDKFSVVIGRENNDEK
jgi:hypothetical protein